MSVSSLGLVVLWLLPLTFGQNGNVTTPTELTEARRSTREASGWRAVPEVAGQASPQTSPPPPASSTRFLPASQTAATPSDQLRFNSSTEGRKSRTENPFNSSASAATAATGDASDRTRTTPRTTPTASSSAQTPSTDEATTQPPTRPTPPPSLISTTNTSTGPGENKTAGTSPVPATRPPGSHTTPRPKTPSVYTAKAMETRPANKEKAGKGPTHGRVVAGLIGGALLVMLLGFLLVYVKKRKLQKQQMATGDWAGPSPFLEGGADDCRVAMRSSNRVSFSSFLTQRLSRRMSVPPAGEELTVMTPASTFGGERKGSRFPPEEGQSNGDAPENNNDISEVRNLSADPAAAAEDGAA